MLGIYLAAILVCVFFSNFFSSSEMAYSACNRVRLENASDDGSKRAAAAVKIVERSDDTLSTILIGNNLVNIAASSLGSLAVMELLGDGYAWVSTVVITTLVIIFGGIHRVAKFSSAVVPAMAVVYLVVAVGVVIWNISLLPSVLMTIIKNAFGIDQAAGGVLGVTIMQGIKRGLFSNEAGEGSAPNAAAVATVSHPVKQGLIQALGVFTDTLVVCTCTAFIILMSGVDITAANGIQLTQEALTSEIGSLGNPFMAIMIWCFAFSSSIGNYYYGEAIIRYISKSRWSLLAYRLAVGGMVMLGAMVTLDIAWGMADITMALLTLCNLAAILMLSHQAVFLLEDYRRQKKAGRDPVFDPNTMPVIAKQLEGWQSPENHQALPADGGRGISPADF